MRNMQVDTQGAVVAGQPGGGRTAKRTGGRTRIGRMDGRGQHQKVEPESEPCAVMLCAGRKQNPSSMLRGETQRKAPQTQPTPEPMLCQVSVER